MKNYKTKVNSKNESKEVQDLFEVMGYEKGMCSLGNYPAVIVTTQDWATGKYCSTRALGLDIPAHESYKEITLAELRDMVKPMQEYLNTETYEYKLANKKPDGEWVCIPEGANYAYKDESNVHFTKLEMGYRDLALIWIRPTQPEALPFIDDNPQSLNEQYAEIEQVRQAVKVKSGSDSDHMADAMSYGFMGIKQDNVNHPNHYTKGKVECIDAIESATVGKTGIDAVCVANVIKYLWRYEEKNGVEDIKKAQWYLQKLIENNA